MTHHVSDFEETEVEEDETDFDVVIVGAGMSGLTAAYRLISAGLNILILEQTESSGGRLLSKKQCKFFYAHEFQSRLNNMIERLKLSKKREQFSRVRKVIHLDKNENSSDKFPVYVVGEVYHFIKMMNESSKNIYFKTYRKEKMNKKLSKSSIEDVLCRLVFFKKSRSICRNLIYVTCGVTQLRDISALWYFIMLNGAGGFLQRLRVNLGDSQRYFIQGGAMNVAELLTRSILEENLIQYHESVYKILFNDDRAHVWTDKGHYKCNYVIIAVPPIESARIIIEPQLPSNMKKAQLSFEHGKNIFFYGICSHFHVSNILAKNIIGIANHKANLRSAYDATCADEEEIQISGFLSKPITNPAMKINLISVFNRCFNNNILRLKEYAEINWQMISGGSPMNVLKPGSLKNHLNFLSETHGRVFFAASEYANSWPGTVDGAIEAGESAACSVLEHIRPQSMNRFEWILYKLIRTLFFYLIQ